MAQQIPVGSAVQIDGPAAADGTHALTGDLAYQRHVFVNVMSTGGGRGRPGFSPPRVTISRER